MSRTQMAPSATAASKTIFVAKIDPTLTFCMVEYADGQLDILRNGNSIAPEPWPSEDLDNCVSAFQKISRLAAAAAHRDDA